ncbi:uncharacterized protein ACR2FA_004379 [Aphomia sociella]
MGCLDWGRTTLSQNIDVNAVFFSSVPNFKFLRLLEVFKDFDYTKKSVKDNLSPVQLLLAPRDLERERAQEKEQERQPMITKLSFLVFLIGLHEAVCVHQNDRTNTNSIPISLSKHVDHRIPPVLAPLLQPHKVDLLTTDGRMKKGLNIPYPLPVAHQFILPTKLHVLPAHSNVHHSSVHTDIKHLVTNENVKIPIITQTVSHSSSNLTHPTAVIPILIMNHLIPLHDLSVIPLHRQVHEEQKLSQYRASMEKMKHDEEEEMNRFRSFYGGFGTGLFFGGHGAGHGFYAYG